MDFGLLGFDLMGPPQLGAGLGVVLRNFKQLFRCFVPFSVYWLFNLMVFGLIAFGLLVCTLAYKVKINVMLYYSANNPIGLFPRKVDTSDFKKVGHRYHRLYLNTRLHYLTKTAVKPKFEWSPCNPTGFV